MPCRCHVVSGDIGQWLISWSRDLKTVLNVPNVPNVLNGAKSGTDRKISGSNGAGKEGRGA